MSARGEERPKKPARASPSTGEGQGARSSDQVLKAIEDVEGQLARLRQSRTDVESRFQGSLAAMTAERDRAQQEAAGARAERDSLAAAVAEAKSQVEASTAEASRLAQEAAAIRAELESARAQLASVRQDTEAVLQAASEAEERAGAVRRELESRVGELEQALAGTSASGEEARRDVEALRARVQELSREAESERARADDAARRASESRDEAGPELAALRAALEEANARAGAEAGRAAEAAREGEELSAKLDMAAGKLRELASGIRERDERLAISERAACDAEERVRVAEGKLREAIASGGGAAPAGSAQNGWTELRRERLRRVRRAVETRTEKLRLAHDGLRERMAQCEQVLTRRRELVEARQIIENAHSKLAKQKSKGLAAAAVFYLVASLVSLGAVSWVVADHAFPATYVATASVQADFGGATPRPNEYGAWQAFHEKLVLDPQLMTRVAERMERRGFTGLGDAATVRTMLGESLTWWSNKDGSMSFELVGRGREHTARCLEVYVSALASEANAMRQRRSDTAQTIVSRPAGASNEPVNDPRPLYASYGLGLSGGTAMLLWFGIWRRLARSKSAFEQSVRIDHLLEDARWEDPIQQIVASGQRPV